MVKEEISKIRQKPGESNAGKYKTNGPYAGSDKSYPINTLSRARNALSRAHFAKNPQSIEKKVYAEYPALKKRHEERQQDKKYDAYKSS
jgi:hypothetical protein